jgi:hypothetical protein
MREIIELKNNVSQDGMKDMPDLGDPIEERRREFIRIRSIPKSYLKNTAKVDQAIFSK